MICPHPFIVVIDLELQHLLVADRVGDHIRMKFAPEYAGSRLRTRSIFRKDRRAGEAELAELLELPIEVLLCLTKLAAMALVENEDDALDVDRQVALLCLHPVVPQPGYIPNVVTSFLSDGRRSDSNDLGVPNMNDFGGGPVDRPFSWVTATTVELLKGKGIGRAGAIRRATVSACGAADQYVLDGLPRSYSH